MGKVSVFDTLNNEVLSIFKRRSIEKTIKQSTDKEDVSTAAQYPVPVYQVIDGINHIVHPNKPSAITLGHNKNYQTKSQISMVAGTLGSLITENAPGTTNPVEVAYPTPTDAASVIVSEMTDFGDYNGRSVVSAKADAVGLRAAEIIELRAGGIPFLANGHQTTNKYGGIHLISGNRTDGKDFDLQPMIKGENLKQMMEDLIKSIQNLVTQIKTINNDVRDLKTNLISHTHVVSLNAPGNANLVADGLTGIVSGFITGATFESPGLTTALPPTIAKASGTVTTNLSSISKNFSTVRQNYLEQTSPRPIKSRFNKVN